MENKQQNHTFFTIRDVKNKPYEAPYISSISYQTDVILSSTGNQFDESQGEFVGSDAHWGVTD